MHRTLLHTFNLKIMKGKKTGGRKPGVKNKPRPSREMLHTSIFNQVDAYYTSQRFSDDLNSLDPRDRIAAMEKLARYIIPTQQSQSVDISAASAVSETFAEHIAALANNDQ